MPDMDDEAYYDPFKWINFGSLAYIGNSYVLVVVLGIKQFPDPRSAAFDYNGHSFAGGLLAMYAWRS
jgi:NADH dehydrogenase